MSVVVFSVLSNPSISVFPGLLETNYPLQKVWEYYYSTPKMMHITAKTGFENVMPKFFNSFSTASTIGFLLHSQFTE
jgi:hypothetical protein